MFAFLQFPFESMGFLQIVAVGDRACLHFLSFLVRL